MLLKKPHVLVLPLVLGFGLLGFAAQTQATICVVGDTWVRTVQGAVLLQEFNGDRPPGPGVTVTLAKGNWSRSVVTDEDGYFAFPGLPPGNYHLTADLEGFGSTHAQIQVRLNIELGRSLLVELAMEINSCGMTEQGPWREVRDLQLGLDP